MATFTGSKGNQNSQSIEINKMRKTMRGRTLKIVTTLSVLFAGSLVLNACGNKGPLYLPAERSAAKKADESAKEAATEKEQKPATGDGTAK